jgi:NADPH:quinone reductase-like Zn-dependent oxidoreductase
VVKPVDVVFDLVGGDTLQRSWQVVKPRGMLVSVVSPHPSAEIVQGHEARFAWFVVEPNRKQLIQIGTLLDAGHIRPIAATVLPLSEARQAYELRAKGHTRGKIVLRVLD